MKKFLFVSTLSFILLSLTVKDKIKRFYVKIEQNGKEVKVNDHACVLEKKPFTIVVYMSDTMGILVNCSMKENSYKAARENKPLNEIHGFDDTGMAEGRRNEEKQILVSDDAPSYWYYDSDEDHRFNEVRMVDGYIAGKRVIENIHAVKNRKNIPVGKMKNPLYLVFLTHEWGPDFTTRNETQRDFLKIEWKK